MIYTRELSRHKTNQVKLDGIAVHKLRQFKYKLNGLGEWSIAEDIKR